MGNSDNEIHGSSGAKKRAGGSPTKDFFVRMITRDITLPDCIMDLVDNSLDGAHRVIDAAGADAGDDDQPLNGFRINLSLGEESAVVADNCGGISLSDAIDYAFHFGRRRDAPADAEKSLGLYGIGMKRAIFKMGEYARIESSHKSDSFVVTVDVDEWERNDTDWDFDIADMEKKQVFGTQITVSKLHDYVKAAFRDDAFINHLVRAMARDYAFIIRKGVSISINERQVPEYNYKLKEGEDLKPAVVEYDDNGVNVKLVAGLMNELEDEIPEELKPERSAQYGWYVVCNDRVVLAGDKTDLSVWGNGSFPTWHPQYNGFAGFLFLTADDPKKLPWTTTKRDVDVGDALYQRAVVRMKEITAPFTQYTNKRKANLELAKKLEENAGRVGVKELATNRAMMEFPKVTSETTSREKSVTISYSRPKAEVRKVQEALGDPHMSAREAGRRTFEYYWEMEIEES